MKKYFLLFILTIIGDGYLIAQNPASGVDTTGFARLKSETIKGSKAMDLVYTLSDIYGPKPSFSPALARTSVWLMDYLKELGLHNIHQEGWLPRGRSWEVKAFSAETTAPYYKNLIAYPRQWSPPTNGMIRAEAIQMIAYREADLEQYKGKLNGKIVLVGPETRVNLATRPFVTRMADSTLTRLDNIPLPTPEQHQASLREQAVNDSMLMQYLEFQSKVIDFCAKEGAVIVADAVGRNYGTCQVWPAISTEPAKEMFEWFSKSAFSGSGVTLPQITISVEEFNSMVRAMKKGEKVFLSVNLDVEFKNNIEEKNLIAEIPGTDLKNEVVIIGGHLDGFQVGTNAIDNNCGIAACLEALRAIKKLGIQPRRTIRVAFWTGEEQGCLGSRAYVASHFTSGQKEKLQVYFNMDNGAGRFRGINAEENPGAKKIFQSWMQAINDPKFQTVSLQRVDHTDHWAFTLAGLPGFEFIQDPLDYSRSYHTNMDLPERIPPDDLKQDAFLLAAFAWLAANMEGSFQQ